MVLPHTLAGMLQLQVCIALCTLVSRSGFPSATTSDIQINGQAGWVVTRASLYTYHCAHIIILWEGKLLFLQYQHCESASVSFFRGLPALCKTKAKLCLETTKEGPTKAHYCCRLLLIAVSTSYFQDRKYG